MTKSRYISNSQTYIYSTLTLVRCSIEVALDSVDNRRNRTVDKSNAVTAVHFASYPNLDKTPLD